LCRNSKFKEAQTLLDDFFITTFDQLDLAEQSKALLRQVLVAYKAWDLRRLGNFYDQRVKLLLTQDELATEVKARLLYAQQRVRVALAFKDQRSGIDQVTALRQAHQENFEVAKYFVKVHINVPKDGFIIDSKQTFRYFLAAEKVAEEISSRCPRLTRKIQLMKMKTFEMFFTE